MENAVFRYNYSASQNREVEAIRQKYIYREESKLDELRRLDRKAKKPADIFAYTFGSLSAVIMGSGMSLVMTDLASIIGLTDGMIPGIAIGVAGLAMALINYPIYKNLLVVRRKKYAGRIIELSNKIMKG